MKIKVTRTSDWTYKETMVFVSLLDLLDFVKEQGECILTPPDIGNNFEWRLEIYDTWRE